MVTKTILVSLRQEIRSSRCIDLRRRLWDQAWLPTNTLLGDSTCWRRSINLPVAHPEHLFDSLNNILYGDKDNTCFYGTRALSKNNWSRFMTTKRFEGYFHRFIKYFGISTHSFFKFSSKVYFGILVSGPFPLFAFGENL